jgi:parallel beta-helix repeat protein
MRTLRRDSISVRYTPLVAALACAFAVQNSAAGTIMVVNNSDSGAGSLRQAIVDANGNCGSDPAPVIQLNIPSGPFVIALAAPLPQLNCFVGTFSPTIDGYTAQPGASPNTLATGFDASIPVVLDGSGLFTGGCGLDFHNYTYGGILTVAGLEIRNFNYGGSGWGLCGQNVHAFGNRILNNVKGIYAGPNIVIGDVSSPGKRNVIGGNSAYGIYVAYGGSVSIANNFIGTLDGSTASANSVGIFVSATTASIDRNVISGNSGQGIYLQSESGSTVTGNKIGTNSSGSAALGNGTGIAAIDTTSTLIENNVISANSDFGIDFFNANSLTIKDNSIGTNGTRNAALPNNYGVSGYCGTNVTLQDNYISGNSLDGVLLQGVGRAAPASPNILYNHIGIGSGGAAIPNGGDGLVIQGGDCSPTTSSYNGLLQNYIANNVGVGVELGSGIGNALSRNEIYLNVVKNIDINNNYGGPLPNDPGDGDTGVPNNQQNYPTIDSVVQSGGNTIVSFTLDSAPSSNYHIEFFENPAMGAPAGRTYLADTFIPTGAVPGPVSGSLTITGLHNYISLTASVSTTAGPGVVGDTSEFSPMGAFTGTPGVSLSSTALDFGSTPVGSSSSMQSVTVSSVGTAPYQINTFDSSSSCYGGPFCYGGGFTCSTTCSTSPSTYAPGTSCSVSASFSPSFTGPQTTTIFLCDNAAGSPRSITLSGNGTVPAVVTISPSQWDFGNTLVGSKSPTKSFSINNSGSGAAPIGPVSTTGAFTLVSTNCTTEIPAGGSCGADVLFAPTQPGFTSGSLVVPNNTPPALLPAPKSSAWATAPLYGTGVQNSELAMPSSVNVGSYTLGDAPISTVVELRNTGNAVLTFSNISATAPFTVVNNCPVNLAPGDACTIVVGFSATEARLFNGTLTVVSNAPGGSRAIPLTAVAQLVALPVVRVTPTFIGFGSRMFGTQSDAQRINVVNDGGAPATLSTLGVGVDFLIVNTTCGLTLASQATCYADVAFRPLGFGPRPGQFSFTSNSANSPHVVQMLGTGCRPFMMGNRAGAAAACAP